MFFVKNIYKVRIFSLITLKERINCAGNKTCHFSNSTIWNNRLIVEPKQCCHDEPVNIKAVGLNPGSKVTITSSMKDLRGHKFMTYLHFLADSAGTVDLNTAECLGGTYTGVFPMGPIANMIPGPKEHKYLRFSKKDVMSPFEITFNLVAGHVDVDAAANPVSSSLLDSVLHQRLLATPGVQRISVRSGKIRATLFLPEGEGPFPGVIDLFGSAGGLAEFRSAQLANRGIASLALAFFDFEDLPKELNGLDMAYFEEAAHYLCNHPKVTKSGIGAIGVSKGADLACSIGTFIPEVKAVVCINGLPLNTWATLKVKDHVYPSLNYDVGRAKIINPQLISGINMMDNSDDFPETYIPLHESNAKFLFLVCLDDQNWKTKLETDRAVKRMKDNGNDNFEVVEYEGAGHLLEPPFSPFCKASYHSIAGVALTWGGNGKDHSAAQILSWKKMLHFIKTTLV